VNADLAGLTDQDAVLAPDSIVLNANDGRGGRATQTIAVDVQNVTIDPVDGNNLINNAEAHAAGGVPVSGTVAGLGLPPGTTFVLTVADGAFAKGYTATVGANGSWTATIPSADAVQLADGTATITAQLNPFVQASEQVTVHETLPTLTLNQINGNGSIDNDRQDRDGGDQGGDHRDDRRPPVPAPIVLSGAVTGIAPNSTFQVTVTDGSFAHSYVATVNAAGTGWTATVPGADVARLPNGTATFTALVTDQFGNVSLPAVRPVTVEGTTPIVLAVAVAPAAGELGADKTVVITLTMNEPVKVTGSPRLDLNDDASARFDKAHSTATTLVFDYTVADGQNTSDLKITGFDHSDDATIRSLAGDDADLSGAMTDLGLVIDTRAPTVSGVTASPGSGEVTTGHSVTVTLKMSEAVTVAGTPQLRLNDGGTAVYDPASSSATALAFDYTVAAGQKTADLRIAGVELPSRSAIADLAGNPANLEGAEADLRLGINAMPTPSRGSDEAAAPDIVPNVALLVSHMAAAFEPTGFAGIGAMQDDSTPARFAPASLLAQPANPPH
jgi:hypothetical protein